MPTPDRSPSRRPATAPIKVAALQVQRADGESVLWRILPAGGWRLREYDAAGDEIHAD